MIDREKVIKGLENTEIMLKQAVDRGGEMAVMGAFKCYNHVSDAIALLKEQEAMSWINVKDGLPNENGSYLVVYKAFQYALVDVKRFAKDLYSVDEYDFPNEHRPGWYEYDDEYGYIERNDITHWMPLPNLPEKGR